MVGEALAGLSAFKSMFDIAKGLKDISDAATRNAVAIELQEKILAAQMQQAALIERVGQLEKEVAQFETWETEKQRYQLQRIIGYSEVLGYSLKGDAQPAEEPHCLCANCFEQRHKSILQKETRSPGMAIVYACHRCGADFYVQGDRRAEHGSTTRR